MGDLTFDDVKQMALELPEVREEVRANGSTLYIGKKFLAVSGDEGKTLIMKLTIVERDLLIELEPDKYFITDHHRPYAYVLVRLALVDADEVRDLFHKAWRMLALKKWVKEHPEI